MKNPASLSHAELLEIVTGMAQILYGIEQDDGSWTYAADKEWCGGDVCEASAGLLDRFGLLPEAEDQGGPIQPATTPPGQGTGAQAGIQSPQGQSPDEPQGYTFSLDGSLFRRQRQFLLFLMERSRDKGKPRPQLPADAEEMLEGLISLTDEIADQAHDRYGIDCLLTSCESPSPTIESNGRDDPGDPVT